MSRIAMGCDHRGLTLKKPIVSFLEGAGHICKDFGCFSTDPVDYPDIACEVARGVASGDYDQGILICDTGIGMSIAANKVKGIRAALCCNSFSAQRARQHNDANILCLRADDIDTGSALDMVKAFLTTDFEGGRHLRRVNKIRALEEGFPHQ